MRYLARRYGDYRGFRIPDVVRAGDERLPRQDIESRRHPQLLSEDILVINRIDRRNARNFVRTVMRARLENPGKIIYLPAFGLPYDYPLLFYLGIDVLDDSPLHLLGNERCVSEFGVYQSHDCLEMNLRERDRVMKLVNSSLEHGKFRELVENLSVTSFAKEALRIADFELFDTMEPFMDLREKRINAMSVESIYRPEVEYFRRKISGLSQTSDNLLLIPCSAVKPYSRSKTHRLLHSVIREHLAGIQEVIVTSPLGLVPREVERFFPAAYYDIPVTGHWFGEEKEILRNVGRKYFSGKSYRNVFFILPREEAGIVEMFEGARGIEGPINYENSEKLLRILEASGIRGDRKMKERREIANVLKYLYSVDLKESEISIKDEGNRKIMSYGGKMFAKFTEGGVRMMSGLAEHLNSEGIRVVEVEGAFKGSNVFIPGIKSVSKDVRPGMEVALVSEGKVIGSGISQVAYFDVEIERKGAGVADVSYF